MLFYSAYPLSVTRDMDSKIRYEFASQVDDTFNIRRPLQQLSLLLMKCLCFIRLCFYIVNPIIDELYTSRALILFCIDLLFRPLLFVYVHLNIPWWRNTCTSINECVDSCCCFLSKELKVCSVAWAVLSLSFAILMIIDNNKFWSSVITEKLYLFVQPN